MKTKSINFRFDVADDGYHWVLQSEYPGTNMYP
jgi:hypothetical protein